jgi:hypothetical protein
LGVASLASAPTSVYRFVGVDGDAAARTTLIFNTLSR